MKTTDLRSLLLSPVGATLLVAMIYLGIVLGRVGGDPIEFARIGTRFSQNDPGGTEGYDGQFVYYIARDLNPTSVAPLLDVPAYRYQRILLPLVAYFLSLGNDEFLTWLIPVINLVFHLLAVWFLAKLFERWGANRWFAVIYGLWPGILLALRLDLPEPLAFGLVIVAIWFAETDSFIPAFICFGLSLFAKETALFFVGAFFLSMLFQKKWRNLAVFFLVAILPYAVFRLWLLQQFGGSGFALGGLEASPPELIPFMGLWRMAPFNLLYFLGLVLAYFPSIILPSIGGIWSSVKRLASQDFGYIGLSLLTNAAIFPFMPLPLYISTGGTMRLATGLVLATLLYVSRYKLETRMKYLPLWLAMNAVVLQEFFGSQVGLN